MRKAKSYNELKYLLNKRIGNTYKVLKQIK